MGSSTNARSQKGGGATGAAALRTPRSSIRSPIAVVDVHVMLDSDDTADALTATAATVRAPAASSPRRPSSSARSPPQSARGGFFSRLTRSWEAVQVGNDGLELGSLLVACAELANIYDRMGAFLTPAKRDLLGIIATLHAARAAMPPGATAEGAIDLDVERKLTFADTKNRKGVSFNLLWLSRALRFILQLCDGLHPDHAAHGGEPSLRPAAHAAYVGTLQPYHGWLLSKVFGAMVGQLPVRAKFVASMCEGAITADEMYEEMRGFVATAAPLVGRLHDYLCMLDLNDPWRA